jgi:hypothetical protein
MCKKSHKGFPPTQESSFADAHVQTRQIQSRQELGFKKRWKKLIVHSLSFEVI